MEGSANWVDCGCEELGAEEPGLDEHGADAERGDLGSQTLHEALDAELGGGVGGEEVTLGCDAGGRGHGDHEARTLGTHLRQRSTGDVDRTEQRGLDLGAPVLGGHLLEEPGVEAAGVVHQDVEVPEPLHGCVDRGLGGCGVGDVESHGEEVLVLAEGVGDALGLAGGGDHGVAGGQRCPGDVDAQASACAGDEPYLLLGHLGCTSFC